MTDAKPATPEAPPVAERSLAAILRELGPFLRPYVGRIVLAMACLVAAKLANLGVPLVLKALVDGLDVEPSLMMLPVGLLLAYGAARLSVTLFTELRQVVFARLIQDEKATAPGAGLRARDQMLNQWAGMMVGVANP